MILIPPTPTSDYRTFNIRDELEIHLFPRQATDTTATETATGTETPKPKSDDSGKRIGAAVGYIGGLIGFALIFLFLLAIVRRSSARREYAAWSAAINAGKQTGHVPPASAVDHHSGLNVGGGSSKGQSLRSQFDEGTEPLKMPPLPYGKTGSGYAGSKGEDSTLYNDSATSLQSGKH